MSEDEVMLGDWVKIGGTYRQIESLEESTDGKWWFWCSPHSSLCLLSEHEPVPITQEILSAVGFTASGGGAYHIGSFNKAVYVNDRGGGEFDIVVSKNTQSQLSAAKYVHEFQHFLKLCGMTLDFTPAFI